jgi:hypothetical protein
MVFVGLMVEQQSPSGGSSAAACADAQAAFERARPLLLAPSSPGELRHAIELLESASERGSAPATELRALLEAMGIARPQNWDNALDLLLLAAEQGSETALGQLSALAGTDAIAGGVPDRPRDIRASLRLSQLFRCPERRALSESPRIRVLESFASPAECRWLIGRARPRLAPATVIKKSGEHGLAEGRSNSGTAFQVAEMDVVMEVIRSRIAEATRMPLPLFEPTQILHYAVGQEFRPHYDFLDSAKEGHRELLAGGQRIATFLIYLNADFTGGETDFPAVGIRYRGGIGDAIFWANLDREGKPDPLSIHAGLPPASGEKWVLSQWIRDRAS